MTKIGFQVLSNAIFKKSVAFPEAEIFRFFMLQLATNTLYSFKPLCVALSDQK